MPDTHRLRRLTLVGLFGPDSPTIDIPFRLQERVTVLHGRNGSGKTITLQLLEALRRGAYGALLRYPLARLSLQRGDGAVLELLLSGAGSDGSPRTAPAIRYRLCSQDGNAEEGELVPTVKRSLGRRRIRMRDGIVFSEPEHIKEFRTSLPSVKLIRTDRLYVRHDDRGSSDRTALRPVMLSQPENGTADEPHGEWSVYDVVDRDPQLMVDHLSNQIRTQVQDADQQYRLTSTRLDSTLPQRLFQHQGSNPSADELRTRAEALQKNETRLQTLGLLRDPPTAIDQHDLSEAHQRMLSIILRDREEKLAPFNPVADKAERLLESLNRKLQPKQVKLDVEDGYKILTANGTPLKLNQLSSGEQHELVLLHELLFDVAPGSLILIDEPELSLHVTWQNDLLPELMDVARLADLDFVLATHSPYIIGDHDGLMVRLGEPV